MLQDQGILFNNEQTQCLALTLNIKCYFVVLDLWLKCQRLEGIVMFVEKLVFKDFFVFL